MPGWEPVNLSMSSQLRRDHDDSNVPVSHYLSAHPSQQPGRHRAVSCRWGRLHPPTDPPAVDASSITCRLWIGLIWICPSIKQCHIVLSILPAMKLHREKWIQPLSSNDLVDSVSRYRFIYYKPLYPDHFLIDVERPD